MKRSGLISATLCTVLFTGLVLWRAGWCQARTGRFPLNRLAEVHSHTRVREALASDSGWRWRHCQPSHWRACLLQH